MYIRSRTGKKEEIIQMRKSFGQQMRSRTEKKKEENIWSWGKRGTEEKNIWHIQTGRTGGEGSTRGPRGPKKEIAKASKKD